MKYCGAGGVRLGEGRSELLGRYLSNAQAVRDWPISPWKAPSGRSEPDSAAWLRALRSRQKDLQKAGREHTSVSANSLPSVGTESINQQGA